jgi:outer membrane protein OmpA-like peptidoglycan-associated protein
MRRIIAVAAVAGCLAASPALADTRTSKPEAVGVGMGATVGALAGGPIGFIVGAAVGAKIGDEFHQKDRRVEELDGELHIARNQAAKLERTVRNLHASLESERQSVQRLRASAPPDLTELLRDGVAIDLLFRTAEDELTAETQRRLAELACTLGAMPEIRLHLDGYADERGDAAYNQALSERRAQHVRDLLTGYGVPGNRITFVAHGESVAADARPDSYALERRVSMTLLLGDTEAAVAANPE